MKIPIPRALVAPAPATWSGSRAVALAAPDPPRRHLLWMLIVVALVQSLVYALVIPPWQAPDETRHFEYVWTMARLGRIPGAQDASPDFERLQIQSLYQYRYGDYIQRPLPKRPPARLDELPGDIYAKHSRTLLFERFSLAFVLPALLVRPLQQTDLAIQLYAARAVSVLCNVLIVVLAFFTYQQIQPDRQRLHVLAAVGIALLPQHTFINSAVSEGPLAELICCWVLYCWMRLFRCGPRLWLWLGVALGAAAGALTKATALFLIPTSVLLAIWWLASRSHIIQRVGRRRTALIGLSALLLLAALLWLTPAHSRILEIWQRLPPLANLRWHDVSGMSLGLGMLLMYNSFWANFGWMALPVDQAWYIGIYTLSAAAIVGWAVGKQRGCGREPVAVLLLFVGTAAAAFVIGGFLAQEHYWIQGRYLFTLSVPFAFLFLHGISLLAPPRWRLSATIGVVLLLAAFNITCLLGYIIPYFYG